MITSRRALGLWFLLLAVAFANGAFRELYLIRYLGVSPLLANQVSCVTGVGLWTVTLLIFWKKLGIVRIRQALAIGAGWLVATVLFETFVLNRNLSWAQILHTYDVSAGQYWGLVVLWVGIMPLLAWLVIGPAPTYSSR